MKKDLLIIAIVLAVLSFTSCEKLLEPAYDNSLSDEMIWINPIYAEGVLLRAYVNMPGSYDFTSDMATDDALSNEKGDAANRMASGEWSSQYNPISIWSNAYTSLFYINTFLENMHRVEWAYTSETTSDLMAQRLRGEAFGLRAWYQFQLLQAYSGFAGGELLGFPIVTKVLDEDNFNIPRGSFKACVDTIMSDCSRALSLLPAVYDDTRVTEVDNAMGSKFINRISGTAVHAIMGRVALYRASQAYNTTNDLEPWETAMKINGDLVDSLGGVSKLPRKGFDFYARNSGSAMERETELIWYATLSESFIMEQENFPPSHFGDGKCNPTQELVDAFPAKDGYPIDQSGVYDPAEPYNNRDKRFDSYIIYNGSRFKGVPLYTHTDDPIDGINAQETSTKTGYYLRKFMNESVLLDPRSEAKHFYTYIRATEVFLNFAEAANEFGGPGYVYNEMSALDVMHALRKRAGITNNTYLDGLGQSEMREAIRNERRIELCFEGHRFWDIRRWNLTEKMAQSVSGITIAPDNTYSIQTVADRIFFPHMIYGPIPFNETLKMDIKQNDSW